MTLLSLYSAGWQASRQQRSVSGGKAHHRELCSLGQRNLRELWGRQILCVGTGKEGGETATLQIKETFSCTLVLKLSRINNVSV